VTEPQGATVDEGDEPAEQTPDGDPGDDSAAGQPEAEG
jgi:hypothetical protein